jgi:hypothetical protein
VPLSSAEDSRKKCKVIRTSSPFYAIWRFYASVERLKREEPRITIHAVNVNNWDEDFVRTEVRMK